MRELWKPIFPAGSRARSLQTAKHGIPESRLISFLTTCSMLAITLLPEPMNGLITKAHGRQFKLTRRPTQPTLALSSATWVPAQRSK
jgi:hypothetical protein